MMLRHVKVIALIHIVLGALITFAGVVMGGLFLFVDHTIQGAPVAQTLHPTPDMPMPDLSHAVGTFGGIGLAIGLIMGVPGIIAGIGLLRRASWGRTVGIAVGILDLLFLTPFHIGLGIYTLVVLTDKATIPLFQGASSHMGTSAAG